MSKATIVSDSNSEGVSRFLAHHVSLLACLVLGFGIVAALPDSYRLSTRILVAWNVAALLFTASVLLKVARTQTCTVRQSYAAHDDGRLSLMLLSLAASAASLCAIFVELSLVKQSLGILGPLHIALTVVTVLTSWSFIHVIFALHYANLYYNGDPKNRSEEPTPGGISLPGSEGHPSFLDFLYFSVTIGICCATSDINVTAKAIRRDALIHGVFSFFFNMTVLGLSINMISNLF